MCKDLRRVNLPLKGSKKYYIRGLRGLKPHFTRRTNNRPSLRTYFRISRSIVQASTANDGSSE